MKDWICNKGVIIVVKDTRNEMSIGGIELISTKTSTFDKGWIVKADDGLDYKEKEYIYYNGGEEFKENNEKYVAINFINVIAKVVDGKIIPVNRNVILKYSKADIEGVNMKNGIYLDPRWQAGYFTVRKATVLTIADDCERVEKSIEGKESIVNYLVSFDERHQDTIKRNQHFIEKDKDENEYRWAHEDYIYATLDGENINPLTGRVFCSVPEKIEEKKEGGIIIIEQEVKTNREGYYTKVLFINKEDKKYAGFNINVGDEIYCRLDSDIKIEINGKEYLSIPTTEILGEKKELKKIAKKYLSLQD